MCIINQDPDFVRHRALQGSDCHYVWFAQQKWGCPGWQHKPPVSSLLLVCVQSYSEPPTQSNALTDPWKVQPLPANPGHIWLDD